MKILKSYSFHQAEFVVLSAFTAQPYGETKTRTLKVEERVRFDDKTSAAEIIGWCRSKRIALADLPNVAQYRALRKFTHRARGKALVNVDRFDVCQILAEDAWPLLLRGIIEPINEAEWSPGRLMPKKEKDGQKVRESR